MDPEFWAALSGVALGAVLGGGIQILTDRLRGSRERDNHQRETQRVAYARFFAAQAQARSLVELTGHPGPSAELEDLLRYEEQLREAASADAVLRGAASEVWLVGSAEASALVTKIVHIHHLGEFTGTDINLHLDELTDTARRDLGLPVEPDED